MASSSPFFSRLLLGLTAFRSPLLRTVVPSIAAAAALQAAVGLPSVLAQTERFYDISGTLTYLAVGALSLCLPVLRARAASSTIAAGGWPSLLAPFAGGSAASGAAWNWRQVLLTGAVALWAVRREC
jgi:hypothetical protein